MKRFECFYIPVGRKECYHCVLNWNIDGILSPKYCVFDGSKICDWSEVTADPSPKLTAEEPGTEEQLPEK